MYYDAAMCVGTLFTAVCVPMCEQGGMNVAGTLALESCLSTSLPSAITVKDPAIEVLALLRILYGISKYWHSLYLVCTYCSPPSLRNQLCCAS